MSLYWKKKGSDGWDKGNEKDEVKCIQGKRKGRERERIHKDVCT